MIALFLMQASVTTECHRTFQGVVCESHQRPDYAAQLAAGRALVPSWQRDGLEREQLKALRLQNELLEQQVAKSRDPQ